MIPASAQVNFHPQAGCPHWGLLAVWRPVLDQGCPAGRRYFTCKLLPKTALVKCPSAFRLRRLARTVGRALGRQSLPVDFRAKWLLCNVRMHFDCEGSHSAGRALGRGHFARKFLYNIVQAHFNCAGSRKVWSAVLSTTFYLEILAPGGSPSTSTCISTAQARAKRGSWSCKRSSSTTWQSSPLNIIIFLLLNIIVPNFIIYLPSATSSSASSTFASSSATSKLSSRRFRAVLALHWSLFQLPGVIVLCNRRATLCVGSAASGFLQ